MSEARLDGAVKLASKVTKHMNRHAFWRHPFLSTQGFIRMRVQQASNPDGHGVAVITCLLCEKEWTIRG